MAVTLLHEVKVSDPKNTTTYHLPSGRKITNSAWVRVPLTDLDHPHIEGLIDGGFIELREVSSRAKITKPVAAPEAVEATTAKKSRSKAKAAPKVVEPVAEEAVETVTSGESPEDAIAAILNEVPEAVSDTASE